ncbi:hypothetical protein SpCBS45565_g08096 [Spizellomyces sp. 'palustris']|nr:hypothetical protein SpCBS45565_g08096 [Spizellomyces sp. 'palustris']
MGDSAMQTEGAKGTHLSPESQQAYEDIIQALQRDINVLSDPTSDRLAKRRALDHIQRETLGKRAYSADRALMRQTFTSLCKPLVKCLSDTVEKCRELSSDIILRFSESVDDVTPFLAYIVPAISARLSQTEIVEPSEEIRLLLVQLLVRLVNLTGAGFIPFVEDAVKVLQRTLQDPFPNVKKESCNLVIQLSRQTKKALGYHGASIAKAVVPCLQHRHSSVRTSGLQAIREAIMVDASGLDDVLDTLRQITLDKSQSVRESIYVTAAEWMLNLPDRWSVGYKILPLLLAGMTDELPKLAEVCRNYMDDIGKLYETDWEDRVKDELDYMQLDSDRPRVGCRHVVRDNTQKIVAKTLEGLADWNADVRAKSAQVLATFITYAEDMITGYAGIILPALYRVLAGDEVTVCKQAIGVAELLGRHVDTDVYLDIILPAIRTGGGGSTQFRLGCLRALAGLVRGTPMSRFSKARLERVSDLVSEKELAQNENTELLAEVAGVVVELVKKVPPVHVDTSEAASTRSETVGVPNAEEIGRAGYVIFLVLARLSGVSEDDKVPGVPVLRQKTEEALRILATAYGLFSVQDLYALHLDAVLAYLAAEQSQWTRYSPEPRLLDTILTQAGPLAGQRLEVTVPLLSGMAGIERDIEVRESMFKITLSLLHSPSTSLNSTGQFSEYSRAVLSDIIIANGVWKPGRKAALLRGKAIETLLALLNGNNGEECLGFLRSDALMCVWEPDLMNVLVGTLEDDDADTRNHTLMVLSHLLRSPLEFTANTFKKLYQELLKRMDDAHDSLRVATARVWNDFFEAVGSWQQRMSPLIQAAGGMTAVMVHAAGNVAQTGELVEVKLDDVHWAAIVKGLTVHMDDPNAQLQECVFNALKASLKVAPANVMRDHWTGVRLRHRIPTYIDELLTLIPQ